MSNAKAYVFEIALLGVWGCAFLGDKYPHYEWPMLGVATLIVGGMFLWATFRRSRP